MNRFKYSSGSKINKPKYMIGMVLKLKKYSPRRVEAIRIIGQEQESPIVWIVISEPAGNHESGPVTEYELDEYYEPL